MTRVSASQFARAYRLIMDDLQASDGAAVMAYRRARQRIRLASIEITQPTPSGFGCADPNSDKRERKRQASAEFRQRSGE